MIFSVSNDGIQWTLDFGPGSVTIAVNDPKFNNQLTRNTPSCLAFAVVSKTSVFENHLAQVPITPKQQGTFEMREEVLSSVGAQGLDTSRYQVSDLEDIEFKWENSQLHMDAVFRPG